MASRPRPRVVVLGAGFGGINATRALATGPFEITIVDRDNYHGFWPLLYEVATAALGPDDIAHPLRGLFGQRPNIRVRLGTVSGLDVDKRLVELEDGENIPYDYLVLAVGSSTTDFGIPGVAEHAFPLKTLPDAVRLRNHILTTFERANANPSLLDDGVLTIVVAGGGPTGVEMAGALSELIGRNLATDFPQLEVTQARVVVVEMADHLLGGFSPVSQASALKTLQTKGIEVWLNAAIAAVAADRVTLKDGAVVTCGTVVWTAGVRPNPVADYLGLAQAKGGAVKVNADLSVPGHPEVFVIGDLSGATDRLGRPYPQMAQVAIQGGRHVARSIRRRQKGKRTHPFRYHDHGIMATIGRRSAVAELPLGLKLRGTPGWLAWLGVHLVFLIGFRNRVIVLIKWAWNYLTWDRASRVILDDGSHTPTGQRRA
ncbi:MAG TPA: NAD(P)/FAD-dependent oxidoreductase [Acidimicrobiales bacterium]|nr:NAD(P)/FAD-dependent oxidoreductase [Acidimicrobiales bacterium]